MKLSTTLFIAALAPATLALPTLASADDGPVLDLPPEPDTRPADRINDQSNNNTLNMGGYAEMHYNATFPEDGETKNQLDFHRFVLYVGRQWTEKLKFYSEIEVEHAIVGDGKVGEVSVEQAYLDYQLSGEDGPIGELTLRTGIVLIPMGIVNQWHEPPIFHGVERPSVEKVIIPTTWREGGIGLAGKVNSLLSYELYVLGGLDPSKFSAGSGIRGGRQKAGKTRTDGLAFTGRVQLQPTTQTVLGVSGYYNKTGENADINADVPVLGVSLDARTRFKGLEARAVFAMFTIGDSDTLNTEAGTDVADNIMGAYGELAYNVLHNTSSDLQLLPFLRLEYYDTDPDDDTKTTTDIVTGLTFRPIPQVVFKSDVIFRRKGGNVDGDNATILNLGMGFLY